jgi:hypothetical protein
MPIAPYDLLGLAGAAIAIVAYFCNQQGWLASADWRFPFANLLAALLILVSLWFRWNDPSVVIEVFWAAISIWGLVRVLARHRGE